ncbi:MAG TPA: TIGR02206 family membrane protein [Anaeromyxobacter sp.]|nr:TIGR02206 family membrane protein [Anaeromyxobacter sp.]
MSPAFRTFAPAHLAVVAAVPLAAAALAAIVRRRPGAERPVRLALAAGLAANELAWYVHALREGWVRPPHGLPLDLCDVLLWLTVWALAAPRPWTLDVVYYLGLAGSGMALLTPDPGAALGTYEGAKFFLAHGGVVGAILFLVLAGRLRPRPGSWWRVFLWVNAYASVIALVDWRFGANYMYLREKPASASLLDVLGPWPWYVLAAEPVALLLLWLLQLPFHRGRSANAC